MERFQCNERTRNRINAQQLSVMTGVSVKTLDIWYMWKRLHPEHELAQLLPDYTQEGSRNKRYWDYDAIYQILEFRKALPRGRGGIMGEITQKYIRKRRKNNVQTSSESINNQSN